MILLLDTLALWHSALRLAVLIEHWLLMAATAIGFIGLWLLIAAAAIVFIRVSLLPVWRTMVLLFAVLALAMHVHNTSPAPITYINTDNVPRVAPQFARALIRNGLAFLIDVRAPVQYASGHLSGAINIPANELPRRLDELPRDRLIVAYCG